jgi:hypothetical protein
MATVTPPQAPPAETAKALGPNAEVTSADASQALVPVPRLQEVDEGRTFSRRLLALPVEVDVAVPIRGFRVRHLLALVPSQLAESQWPHGTDLPLSAGEVQLAWTEFEVVETKLAVRVTRVA